ncbi:MAG: biotin transporter BioY [Candidatus Vecturithrix sp.]|jgi:biotin transport system substrate-specific component|nr:biotin transporter BioY [Candidatus Vecturithrix sp.]
MFMRDTALRAPLIDVLWPAKSLVRDVLLVMATSFVLALSAQIVFPLPFSPVPVTCQTLVVLAAGALLGSRLGALTVLVYLTEGMIGLPFFAKGAAGVAYLRGVTGGYLLGFVAAAFVVGLLVEKGWGRKVSTAIVAMGIGNVLLYVFGIAWLQLVLQITTTKALFLGFYPFIPGDVYKIGIGAILLPILSNFLKNPKN